MTCSYIVYPKWGKYLLVNRNIVINQLGLTKNVKIWGYRYYSYFFRNELATEIYEHCHHGVFMSQDIEDLMLLLFSDDIVLFANNVVNLQRQLNVLKAFCSKWGFQINLQKSEVVVFRKWGIIIFFEEWYYCGKLLKTVSYYKYLGVIFSSRLIWTKACECLAGQATKAHIPVYKLFNKKILGVSFTTASKILDSKIAPILLYGSKIWGLQYPSKFRHHTLNIF